MTVLELTETQRSIISHLAENWQQKPTEAIIQDVPGSTQTDITALALSGHLKTEFVFFDARTLRESTYLSRLTIRGERVADTLQGKNSAEIERAVVSRVLLAIDAEADKTRFEDNIKETAVGPERLGFLLHRVKTDGLLAPRRVSQGGSFRDAYQLTIAGERAVDVLAGRDSQACEQAAAAAVLHKLEAEPKGVPNSSLVGTCGLGPARLEALFNTMAENGQVERFRYIDGFVSSWCGIRIKRPPYTPPPACLG